MTDNNGGKILGVDYGSKRVGLAISDTEQKFALPYEVIANDSLLVKKITAILEKEKIGRVVMGESKDYKQNPNTIHEASMQFKADLEQKGVEVVLEPEFMTSIQAERWQGKNDKIDSSAAAIILQSYLDRIKK